MVKFNLMHGHIFTPASRIQCLIQDRPAEFSPWMANGLESGKFFPAIRAGLLDPLAPTDTPSQMPPEDGKIASAGNLGILDVLNEAGTHWRKHPVKSGQTLNLQWAYSAKHATRRWNYFITKDGWDPEKVLTRDQFEKEPFFQYELSAQPYWLHEKELMPDENTVHSLPLPDKQGYHVILSVWEVANTGNAFYQVIDVEFQKNPNEDDKKPATPQNLRFTDKSQTTIALAWDKAASQPSIQTYDIYRDGNKIASVTDVSYLDSGLAANTEYTYFIVALDNQGRLSLASASLSVKTKEIEVPSAPSRLHAMNVASNVVDLMWTASNAAASPLSKYTIFRDNIVLRSVSAETTRVKDQTVVANTEYHYYVIATDEQEVSSGKSNILTVKTPADVISGAEWVVHKMYYPSDRVVYNGKSYKCEQFHIAIIDHAPDKAPLLWHEVA